MSTTTANLEPPGDIHEVEDVVQATADDTKTITCLGNLDFYVIGKVTVGTATAVHTPVAGSAPAVTVLTIDASGTAENVVGRFPAKNGDTIALNLASGATGAIMVRAVDPRRGS